MYQKNPEQWGEYYTLAFINLANFYKLKNQMEKAIAAEKENIEILRPLCRKNPGRWAEWYTLVLLNLSNSCLEELQLEEGSEALEEALVILKPLYQQNPKKWVDPYITALNDLSVSYYQKGEMEQALRFIEEAYLESGKTLGLYHWHTQKMKLNYILIKIKKEGVEAVSKEARVVKMNSKKQNNIVKALTFWNALLIGLVVIAFLAILLLKIWLKSP